MNESVIIDDNFTVIYSLPGSYDFYTHMPSDDGAEFVISDFKGNTYKLTGFTSKADIDGISSLELHFGAAVQDTSFETYTNSFLQAYSKLNSGDLEKIILSRVKTVDFDNKQILDYMMYLKASNPNAFVYLISTSELGTWIGATPESLVKGNGESFSTMALAGTKPFVKEEEEPKWADKEINEHEIVANGIESVLKNINAEFTRDPRSNHKSGQVVHLKTGFKFKTDNLSKFISELHPSSAISGKPQKTALELIDQIEIHDRLLYTGYLGFSNQNEVRYFVNLRCMQIFKESAQLYLGGGITKDSILEKEWEETEHKAMSLLVPLEKMQKFAGNDFR